MHRALQHERWRPTPAGHGRHPYAVQTGFNEGQLLIIVRQGLVIAAASGLSPLVKHDRFREVFLCTFPLLGPLAPASELSDRTFDPSTRLVEMRVRLLDQGLQLLGSLRMKTGDHQLGAVIDIVRMCGDQRFENGDHFRVSPFFVEPLCQRRLRRFVQQTLAIGDEQNFARPTVQHQSEAKIRGDGHVPATRRPAFVQNFLGGFREVGRLFPPEILITGVEQPPDVRLRRYAVLV